MDRWATQGLDYCKDSLKDDSYALPESSFSDTNSPKVGDSHQLYGIKEDREMKDGYMRCCPKRCKDKKNCERYTTDKNETDLRYSKNVCYWFNTKVSTTHPR